MKALCVALAVSLAVLFTNNDGRADAYYSGQMLNELCSDENNAAGFTEGFCWGYILGAYDSGEEVPGPGTNRREWDGGWTACTPDEVLVGQLAEVVRKWLRAHPEGWHHTGSSQVARALHEAWPCP
jgi:hypothetical protein